MSMTNLQEIFEHHLPYEISMLIATFQRLEPGVTDVVISNALIESFCIHARSLLDFFQDKQGVGASVFCRAAHVAFAGGSPPDDLIRKLNTQIAHLTLRRTADSSQKIGNADRERLVRIVSAELARLIPNLKPEYASGWAKHWHSPTVTVSPIAATTNAPLSMIVNLSAKRDV